MIVLTFDTDWVNEEILKDYVVDILKKKKMKATFFVTGRYECLKNPLFEINPHINFNSDYADYKNEFLKIKKWAPHAYGVRNHSLYFHERLRPIWKELKVKYTSNYFLPLVENLQPYYFGRDLVEFPLYFLDYWLLETFSKPKFQLSTLKLNQPGLKICDFHPIHIGLNTPNLSYYLEFRRRYNPPSFRQNQFKGRGIGTLFKKILDHIEKEGIETFKLNEIYQKFISPSGPYCNPYQTTSRT